MIIPSLLDTDIYKFHTQSFIHANAPTAEAVMVFKNRTKGVDLGQYADKIEREIKALGGLSLSDWEIHILASLNGRDGKQLYSPAYLSYLKNFRLDPRFITVKVSGEGELEISAVGPWVDITLFEIPILAIVNEVYFENEFYYRSLESTGRNKLSEKIAFLNEVHDAPPTFDSPLHEFGFTEFGTRRRYSGRWQREVLERLKNEAGFALKGTSNPMLGFQMNLPIVGTMPHEYLQSFQAFGDLAGFQKKALDAWLLHFRGNNATALTDVVGIDAFLRDFDYLLAKGYDGVRHDSGDPVVWGEKMLAHYAKYGIDPRTKSLLYSDGLTVGSAYELYEKFSTRTNVGFGIGTSLTNDMGEKALNIVMKLTELNGRPVAKLSDSPGKTMCSDEVYLAALRKAQGIA